MNQVLVVDDNTENLYLLRKLLEGNGYAVTEARHGAEALVKARQLQPSLIISDLLMPVMDGYTLLKEWKTDDRLKSTPFVVYTATFTGAKDERLALNLGADAFIVKPSEPEPFMKLIREVLEKKVQGRLSPEHDMKLPVDVLLKDYNEVLIQKLEKRASQLEQANIALRAEINERERAEERVSQSNRLLQALADGISDAIFVKDRAGKYLLLNSAAAAFVGKYIHEVIGRDDTELFDAASAKLVRDHDRHVMETNQLALAEEVLTAAGVTRTYQATKAPYRDANGQVIGLLGISRDISDRKLAEEALRLKDRAIQAVSQGILIADASQPDNPIIFASAGFELITGYPAADVLGKNCRFLQGKDTDPETVAKLRAAISEGQACSLEILNYRKDGAPFWNQLTLSPVLDESGRLTHFVGIQTDVTARRNLEEQFRQVQKMEAVGQLAGGVAHDFNNLLTIINGYSEILLESLPVSDPNREMIAQIHKAGERSADLTRQLLAFSRQQFLNPRVVNLNSIVSDMDKMLRRLIGEDIRLTATLDPGLWAIRADPGQIEQVLMNLAVNARDAMPLGGQLTIETRNIELDVAYAETHPEAKAGAHVLLSVTDTGSGMPPEIQARIFEPFFTTKGPGKGTGLGLPTVYGIVKQSGGHVAVYSEVGIGTVFKLYLPRIEQMADSTIPPKPQPIPPGAETILLVEDDHSVRTLTRRMLAGLGYTVLEAADGVEATRIITDYDRPVHLLVTDVVMPGMGGRAVAERVAARHPAVRVLFVSGYTDDAVVRHGILEEKIHFLPKPFSSAALANKVREILDNKEPAAK